MRNEFLRVGFILAFLIILASPVMAMNSDNHTLQSMVLSDHPEIAGATTDWDRVNILRQWAYEHITVARNSSLNLDSYPGFYQLGALQIFTPYISRMNSSFCGGAAVALQRLYQVYGYPAFSLNTGNPKTSFTHVVTLVNINYNGQEMQVLEDAFFNVAITYPDGSPMPFPVFLQKNLDGDYGSIVISNGTYPDIGIIDTAPMNVSSGRIGWYCITNTTPEIHGRIFRYWGKRTLDLWQSPSTISHFIEQEGRYPNQSLYTDMVGNPFMIDGIWIDRSYFRAEEMPLKTLREPLWSEDEPMSGTSAWDRIVFILGTSTYWNMPTTNAAYA